MNKRRNIIFLIILVLSIMLTGCSNSKDNKEEKKPKEEVNEYVKHQFTKYEWKCSIPLENIKELNYKTQMFITNDGDLYEFDFNGKFSTNDDHCRKIESNFKFVKFIQGAVITTDNKIYGYDDYNKEFVERMSGWTLSFNYSLYDYNQDVFVIGETSLVVEGKNVYSFELPETLENKTFIGTLNDDEEFVRGYHRAIKTTKRYYKYEIISTDECINYVDVECKYGIRPIEEINKDYDKIYYYDGYYLIYKDDLKHIYCDEKW